MTALELIKRSLGRREALVLMVGDEEAKRLLVAWTCYHPAFADFVPSAKDTAEECRDRLWSDLGDINWPRLGQLAAIPESRVPNLFHRLREANLLWPDGTLQEDVLTILRQEITAHVRGIMHKGGWRDGARTDQGRTGVPEPGGGAVPGGPTSEPRADAVRRRPDGGYASKAKRRAGKTPA